MRYLMIFICLLFIGCVGMVQASEALKCADCPPDKHCGYTVPTGDGCNTCGAETWCINGRWYTDGVMDCTAMFCHKSYEIPNPFDKKGEIWTKENK